MAIYADKNQYYGINANLHSILQEKSDDPSMWPGFHTQHIVNLAEALNRQLPRHYIAISEQSLQIKTEDFDTGKAGAISPKPDVSIYQGAKRGAQGAAAALAEPAAPTRTENLQEILGQVEKIIPSVVIRDTREHGRLGKAVTRIELLSASNKRGGSGYVGYLANRATALRSGTSLVELDYLHESHSPISKLPDYPAGRDSHPYYIAVSDPRPMLGRLLAYEFDVDQPIPTITIPLAGDEAIKFSFDAVYQHTFQTGRWGNQVDYEREPDRIETYGQADQARIRARLRAVAEARRIGKDLEQGPFQVVPVSE